MPDLNRNLVDLIETARSGLAANTSFKSMTVVVGPLERERKQVIGFLIQPNDIPPYTLLSNLKFISHVEAVDFMRQQGTFLSNH